MKAIKCIQFDSYWLIVAYAVSFSTEQRKRCDGIDLPIVSFPSVTPGRVDCCFNFCLGSHQSSSKLILLQQPRWTATLRVHTLSSTVWSRHFWIIQDYPLSIHRPNSYCCRVIAGCTSVNLENPIDCCISYDNSAAFLFGFLSSNPPINVEPFNILLRVQFGTWIA